ncbi:MAG: ammonium transporter [Sulfurimonas sp.]|uniref:ammonium transporter n=1 Tax=Sulfurimonas sp. TaxID=2022749 RepID=UPI0025E22B9C|nr:ammonium transporter [Sulfurimonas sp.]MCK9455568.1 ammonium transporter [Sulfurimonas sp.]
MKRYLLALLVLPTLLFAKDSLSSGDTAWMLVATAFVMLMTPAGLALFYGGLTRYKSVINTISMSLGAFAVGSLVWVLVGYSIAFGEGDFIGTGKVMLSGITSGTLSGTVPELLFVAFQGTFAAIAVAIASGSMIERIKFSTFILFAALWIVAVYAPITHWAWGGGKTLHFDEMDFAGGTVVHLNAGVAGLVVAIILGRREDYGKVAIKPFSPVLAALGAALLWFGWFGFNAGSQLAADGVAASAFLVTNVSASLGVIGWITFEWLVYKKATLVGAASGAVAGLVAITPASGSTGVEGAIIIGFIGGALGFYGVSKLKNMFKVDDALDAFWIHGLVGIWGSVATALFIADYAKPQEYNMILQLANQLKAIALTIIYSAVATAIVYFVASILTGGGRVDDESEHRGLDETLHGEKALNL